ncbi:hypothetical protein AALP_AA1G241200 [Arabis alpina]|uniref:FLZ-type domain-containing protein n=1 Tax=Arabis alpina TaxID=50452 RepID=A0A087HQA6_ARAAL|nr:hypothetical protein AALP_AA1G241200 [Arabis alpina]
MLLGKRQRPPIKRTTSLSDIKFDLNLPSQPEPSDQIQIPLVTVHEHRQVADQRMVSHRRNTADYYSTQTGDFLRSCSLCKRHLVPGRDIYMYRGDRGFCSLECRQKQITVDERKKKIPVRTTVVVTGAVEGERVSAAV